MLGGTLSSAVNSQSSLDEDDLPVVYITCGSQREVLGRQRFLTEFHQTFDALKVSDDVSLLLNYNFAQFLRMYLLDRALACHWKSAQGKVYPDSLYGWNVGFQVPTQEQVEDEIDAILKNITMDLTLKGQNDRILVDQKVKESVEKKVRKKVFQYLILEHVHEQGLGLDDISPQRVKDFYNHFSNQYDQNKKKDPELKLLMKPAKAKVQGIWFSQFSSGGSKKQALSVLQKLMAETSLDDREGIFLDLYAKKEHFEKAYEALMKELPVTAHVAVFQKLAQAFQKRLPEEILYLAPKWIQEGEPLDLEMIHDLSFTGTAAKEGETVSYLFTEDALPAVAIYQWMAHEPESLYQPEEMVGMDMLQPWFRDVLGLSSAQIARFDRRHFNVSASSRTVFQWIQLALHERAFYETASLVELEILKEFAPHVTIVPSSWLTEGTMDALLEKTHPVYQRYF